jgi:hypothetical protein
LVGAEEVSLLAGESPVGEKDWACPKEARVNRLPFAKGAQDERVGWGKVVPNVLSYDSSICGGKFEVVVKGSVRVVRDPSFSRVVWVLFEKPSKAVVSGGRSAPLVVRGAISGGVRRRWSTVQLEG